MTGPGIDERLLDPQRLRINSAGHTPCPPDWAWRTSGAQWRDFDLWVVLDGRGRLETRDGTYPLRPGSAFVLRGGLPYAGWQDPAARLVVSHTHFDWLDAAGRPIHPAEPRLPPLQRQLLDLPFVAGVLRRLLDAHLRAPGCLAARSWLGVALRELARQDAEAAGDGADAARAAVEAVRARIHADPGACGSIAQWARQCAWSADHFSRTFRRFIGVAPQEYALRVRLQQAALLLRRDPAPIKAIARRLGYRDVQFFTRQFRARFGVPPGRWRRARGGGPDAG